MRAAGQPDGPPDGRQLCLAHLADDLVAHPDHRVRVAVDGSVLTRSFAELHTDVIRAADALAASGLGRGDLVGILGPNSLAWIVADLALLSLGCIPVALPVAGGSTPVDTGALIHRYHLSALLVSTSVPVSGHLGPGTARLEDPTPHLQPVPHRAGRPVLPDDVASISFSSGTAGTRKGVMLTEAGAANTIELCAAAWGVGPDDDVLIAMPFSAYQQRWLLYLAIWVGCDATVIAPERLFQQLKVLEPTIILGPPSFFEIVLSRVRGATPRDRRRYRAAALVHAIGPGAWTRPLRARLGARWSAMYGTRVRLMLTGSAPVSPEMVRTCQQIGLPLYEVYGSTEAGWITMSTPAAQRIGTAGRAVNGLRLTIAEDGEVLVRVEHPQACGYVFDGVEAQAATFLPDGTIATGDIARLDDDGFLDLVGRKSNILVTRSGVKINPEEIERDIEATYPGARVMVTAVGPRPTLQAIVWLEEHDDERRCRAVETGVALVNEALPESHRIASTVFRPMAELTVENGLLTRNLKLDRSAVATQIFPSLERAS